MTLDTHQRNQCILFKLESAHYVDEPQGEYVNKPVLGVIQYRVGPGLNLNFRKEC